MRGEARLILIFAILSQSTVSHADLPAADPSRPSAQTAAFSDRRLICSILIAISGNYVDHPRFIQELMHQISFTMLGV